SNARAPCPIARSRTSPRIVFAVPAATQDWTTRLGGEGDALGGQGFLDAGDQLEEEGLDAEGVGGTGEDQADAAGAFAGQGAGGAVRLPAQLFGDLADPGAGAGGDAV
ncbi:hypothetical protein ADK43_16805, partial [Streptomyces rimosus subsp. rimosus]